MEAANLLRAASSYLPQPSNLIIYLLTFQGLHWFLNAMDFASLDYGRETSGQGTLRAFGMTNVILDLP